MTKSRDVASGSFNDGISVDNISIDGTEIDLSSGDLTVDVAGDIIFDADGGDFLFRDNANNEMTIKVNDNSNIDFISNNADHDIRFRGVDGSTTITALTFDMSDAGTAIFNNKVGIGGSPATNTKLLVKAGTNLNFEVENSSSNLRLSALNDARSANIGMQFASSSFQFLTGNVGIGIANPTEKLTVVNSSSGIVGRFTNNTNQTLDLGVISGSGSSGGVYYNNANSGYHAFQVGGSERMRIDSSGNVTIKEKLTRGSSDSSTAIAATASIFQTATTNGTIASDNAFVHVGQPSGNTDGHISGISLGYFENNTSYRHTAIAARCHGDGNARRDMCFLVNSTAEAASASLSDSKLTISSGNGIVSGDLNDTSDIGFKENIQDLGNVLDKVKQLKPRTFTWKGSKAARGESVGFIAQEVETVISDNTIIQGDNYDPDALKMTGKSINTIGLVSYLTKALQEQQEIIESLTARITALEA